MSSFMLDTRTFRQLHEALSSHNPYRQSRNSCLFTDAMTEHGYVVDSGDRYSRYVFGALSSSETKPDSDAPEFEIARLFVQECFRANARAAGQLYIHRQDCAHLREMAAQEEQPLSLPLFATPRSRPTIAWTIQALQSLHYQCSVSDLRESLRHTAIMGDMERVTHYLLNEEFNASLGRSGHAWGRPYEPKEEAMPVGSSIEHNPPSLEKP